MIDTSMPNTIYRQLEYVISKHLEELRPYFSFPETPVIKTPDGVLDQVERLAAICECPSDQATYEVYVEALHYQADVQEFLRLMNQDFDLVFEESEMGQLMTQVSDWCEVAGQRFQLTIDEVWDLIKPVTPDHLKELGGGLYEAVWWKPAPMMDVEILQHTDGIKIQGKPFEPKNLPGGISVRFSVTF